MSWNVQIVQISSTRSVVLVVNPVAGMAFQIGRWRADLTL